MVVPSDPSSELSTVVIMVSGFHLIMSFMLAVGTIIGGSRLREVWSIIY